MNRLTFLLTLAATSLAVAAAPDAKDPQPRDGDPPRWAEPIMSSAQRLESSLKESRNALAEALTECRGGNERKACEAQARAQYQRDVTAAKSRAADRSQ